MAAKMGGIDLTASTKINGKMVPKTITVSFPVYDDELKNLIEHFTAPRVFELCLDAWKIERQQPIRAEILRENGVGNGNKGTGPRASKATTLQQLGLRR